MFSVVLVCLSVCLWTALLSYEQITMKFYEGVQGGKMNTWLNFGGDLGLLKWVNEQATR